MEAQRLTPRPPGESQLQAQRSGAIHKAHLPVFCGPYVPAPVPVSPGLSPALALPRTVFTLACSAKTPGHRLSPPVAGSQKWLQPRPPSRHPWSWGFPTCSLWGPPLQSPRAPS